MTLIAFVLSFTWKVNFKSKEISKLFVSESRYLSSLKNKEFLILNKLCSDSISPMDKELLEKELKELRSEIEKLR